MLITTRAAIMLSAQSSAELPVKRNGSRFDTNWLIAYARSESVSRCPKVACTDRSPMPCTASVSPTMHADRPLTNPHLLICVHHQEIVLHRIVRPQSAVSEHDPNHRHVRSVSAACGLLLERASIRVAARIACWSGLIGPRSG